MNEQMKTTIDHLPEEKQEELQELVTVIRQLVRGEMIILFGSFARGDWVEDRYKEDGTTYEYRSDFDLLVVLDTEKRAMRKGVGKKWRRLIRRNSSQETPVNVIFHGVDYLNEEIEEGSYFFLDILKEGVLLYDSEKYTLATPKPLSNERRKEKAQRYFDQWFKSAGEFYDDFKSNFEKKRYSKAAFELHQCAERFYMCTLLVHTDYKPKLHDLEELDRETSRLDDRFKAVFPRTTPEEERLFNLLKKAYIDSRYKLDYTITPEDLQTLSHLVLKLKEITELSCREKISGFGG